MNTGKITISISSDDKWRITVLDEKSGVMVAAIELTLENFSRAMGGLARTECDIMQYPTADESNLIGLKKITETIKQAKAPNKLIQRDDIKDWLSVHPEWQLHDDGTSSQQPHDEHRFIVKRYVTDTE
jgi:hypothetical protein